MAAPQHLVDPFLVKDCALTAIATGERALRLDELRDKIAHVPISCIYHHFWGGRLHTRFAHPDFHNDFSAWAHHDLHDNILAERLNIIDPIEYPHLEDLRRNLIEVIEERLDEVQTIPFAAKDHPFLFIRSKTIVFATPYQIQTPQEFAQLIPRLSTNSIFFHFIEAQRREPRYIDDFSNWLSNFGEEYTNLIAALKDIDFFFLSLPELRQAIAFTFDNYFKTTSPITNKS